LLFNELRAQLKRQRFGNELLIADQASHYEVPECFIAAVNLLQHLWFELLNARLTQQLLLQNIVGFLFEETELIWPQNFLVRRFYLDVRYFWKRIFN